MRRNRESRSRAKLIQEAHLDKMGQRAIDAIHHDIGTPYTTLYAAYRVLKQTIGAISFRIDNHVQAIIKADEIIGGHWEKGIHAGFFGVDNTRNLYTREKLPLGQAYLLGAGI